ncbi:MAG: hypothetical protein KBT39_11195 [Bacteroidales bacterium]|nr:hypothetical protein [Bacteroidales bacterium]
MTYNETEQLIERYLAGETTPEEERQLALEVSRPDAPEDWKIIAEMLGTLTTDEALYDQMMESRRPVMKAKTRRVYLKWVWTAAACLVAIAITVPLVWSRQSTPDVVAYVYGQKVTDEDVVMEMMASTMADVLGNGSDVVAQDLEDIFGN